MVSFVFSYSYDGLQKIWSAWFGKEIMENSPISDVRWTDNAVVVDVAGDIDLHRSPQLQRGLLDVLNKKPERILVNLAGVGYMDSSGVASLVKLLSRTKKLGVTLVLLSPSNKVRSILEITRLDSVFSICESETQAMA